jgi:uridine kinase
MKPLLIGITGGSGSGKTKFVSDLRKAFSLHEMCVISQDDYYRPREEQKTDEQGVVNFDLPKSIDKEAFHCDILKLIDGENIQREEYTFNNKSAIPRTLTFLSAPVIIVEGLFVLHYKKIFGLLDLKVFLHAKENLKVIRRIKRDKVERNYDLEDVLYRYENHVMPSFERYVQPYLENTDLVINNNKDFNMGLMVLKGFIRNYLDQRTTNNEELTTNSEQR